MVYRKFKRKFYPAKKYRWLTIPLKTFKELLLLRRKNKKDNLILVTGARGEGKSTFTGKILFQFKDFDPFVSMVYTKERVFELIKKKNGYIWIDEAVVSAAKGNTMTKANKILHEIVTINRDNFNIVFMLIPFVEDFDSKILQYVSAWVHIDSRGLGVLMLPANKGIFGKKNWDIDSMKKLYEEFLKENQNAPHIPYWIYPNFRGYIKFGKLTKKQQKIVDEIKFLRKNEKFKTEDEEENRQKIKEDARKLEEYKKYASKKIAQDVLDGKIRSKKEFDIVCEKLHVVNTSMMSRINTIFKNNGLDMTLSQKLKEYERLDSIIDF